MARSSITVPVDDTQTRLTPAPSYVPLVFVIVSFIDED